MRYIDTEGLTSLSRSQPGPWRLEDGRILRVSCGGYPIATEEEAREMLATYQVCAASVGTPNAYEVVRVSGGYGVVVDYVVGLGMEVHVAIGSYTPEDMGHAMAELLRRLHARHMEVGRDWNEVFRGWATALSPLVPDGLGDRLVSLVESLPRRHSLLHGDFHAGNIILSNGVLTPIDMEYAGFGHPVFDLSVARSRMVSNAAAQIRGQGEGADADMLEQSARQAWQALLGAYFEDASTSELEELDRRIEVLSGLERSCIAYGIARTGSEGAGERQLSRVAPHVGRIAELICRVERLDV